MPETEIFSDSFPALGGHCDLVFTGLDSDNSKLILQKIKNEIEQLENIIGPFGMISDLYRLNNTEAGNWIEIDPVMTDVLSICSDFYEMSNGAFDVCSGALYTLWENNNNPDQESIALAKISSGFRQLELDEKKNQVRFLKNGMKLDLRAINKAYAADSLKNLLLENKISNCIISFDEEVILALGEHPSGEAWSIGVRNARNENEFIHVFENRNRMTVNTGTLLPGHEKATPGKHLIISPESGLPVTLNKTVSVSGNSAMLSAFLAHVWLILPENDQSILAEQLKDFEIFEAEYFSDDIKTKLTLLTKENYD